MFKEEGTLTEKLKASKILSHLLYYDIFDHPLSRQELIHFCNLKERDLSIVEDLVSEGLVHRLNGYYSVREDEQLYRRRKSGSSRAEREMPRALKMAKVISSFPFVRAVTMSGSLSKGYMDDLKDVDFFIITSPERLWLARTLLIIYKKLILRNSYRYFCLNYFIDEEHLEIEDKNIFTATEMLTLIPVAGKEHIRALYLKNRWVKEYYDIYPYRKLSDVSETHSPFWKRSLEYLLGGWLGNRLDIWTMYMTINYWKRKYRTYHLRVGNSSFKFERHTSKYHPGNFQTRVLEAFERRVLEFESENEIKLNI